MTARRVEPFRITPEDLADLDAKTRNGLAPLLDALNATLQQLVNETNIMRPERTVTSAFTATATTHSVNVSVGDIARPTSFALDQIYRTDADDTTAPYLGAARLTSRGASLLFGGLTSGAQYRFTVTVR